MTDALTIRALYSCEGCHLSNIGVDVPAREGAQTVASWMDSTVRRLAADHRRRSPLCAATALQEVKIPIAGAGGLGLAPVQ